MSTSRVRAVGRYNAFRTTFVALGAILFTPALALAHEVYLLDSAESSAMVAKSSPNPFLAMYAHPYQFLFSGLIYLALLSLVFTISLSRPWQERFSPILARGKRYAAPLARVTLGICLFTSAFNNALFGPELPLHLLGETAAQIIRLVFFVSGTLIALGVYTRVAALPVLMVFFFAVLERGAYMLTYASYLGEILFALMVGGGMYSLPYSGTRSINTFARRIERYAWPVLRIGFGVTILYAAVYAKFLHSNLTLDMIATYHLTEYFPFDPLFIVLGSFILESLIGIFYIIGVQIRWNALFFLFWLTLSLIHFGEAVWPHVILIGLNIAFLLHGYDRYSLEGYFFKKRLMEPLL